jgi:hypothetical protein
MPRKIRDYKDEYAKYQGRPEQIKKRDARNKARADYERKHGALPASVDVDHRVPLAKGGSSDPANLRAVPRAKNRSFARTAKGGMKSQTSLREKRK